MQMQILIKSCIEFDVQWCVGVPLFSNSYDIILYYTDVSTIKKVVAYHLPLIRPVQSSWHVVSCTIFVSESG